MQVAGMWNDFHERASMLAPMWMFGKGMRLGESLEIYKENILFAVIMKVFEREVQDDDRRRRADLEDIAQEILSEMQLEASTDRIERIVTGVLWSGDEKRQEPFAQKVYKPDAKAFQEVKFRYLEEDRLYSQWGRGGETVYKVTEASQNMIFFSREMQEELSIDIEQLYSLQLIRGGNFTRASGRVRDLKGKVKMLINREKQFQMQLQQNPRAILSEVYQEREAREKEIRSQFREEGKNFDDIIRQLERVKNLPEHKEHQQVIQGILEDVDESRQMHDELATICDETFKIQVNIRLHHIDILWEVSAASFKQDIFEDIISAQGVKNPDTFAHILEPLFSPSAPFMLPLEWMWERQDIVAEEDQDIEVETEAEERAPAREPVDWDQVALVWEPIMQELLEEGYYPLTKLKQLSLEATDEWFVEEGALDMWMVFAQGKFLVTPLDDTQEYTDDRECLIRALIRRNPDMQKLMGLLLVCEEEKGETFEWNGVTMTAWQLRLTSPEWEAS